MKENTTKIISRVTKWLAAFAGLLLLRVAEWMHWIDEQRVLRIAIGLGAVVALFVASYYGGSLVYDFGAGVRPQG